MKKLLKCIMAAVLAVTFCLPSVTASATGEYNGSFDYLEYPEEAITAFREEILSRVSGEADYVTNKGYSDTALYISPYWKMTVNEKEVPVYATLNYDRELDGVLQSYQYIFADSEDFSFNVILTFSGEVSNAVCLPQKENVSVSVKGNTISAVLDHTGAFTFLINNDSQADAVTIFVRQNRDEEAEIESYIEQYGEENVQVFDKGYYELDELPFDKKVTYFCKGAYIKAKHSHDVNCADDMGKAGSFMYINNQTDAIITGLGTIDTNSLDWHERNHFTLGWCKDSLIEGLIFLNPSSWTVSAYACDGCTIRDIAVFGYRTNSDGVNICGCSNMTVSDSFCRNGDDCFSVKTTDKNYESKNIKITNCIGWSNKARCFGITGEVYSNISDVEFSDCAVIYRNATWNNDRVCSLAVMAEMGGEDIDNVLFKNIEIYHDSGRPIIVMVTEDELTECNISNVTFENITCNSAEKSKISTQRDITKSGKLAAKICNLIKSAGLDKLFIFARISDYLSTKYNSGNSISVTMKNVTVNSASFSKNKHCETEGNVVYC